MVAIVSGNSLGLNLTSNGVLGGQGVYGNPTTGQGGEQVYVNASTGNLVMQQLQDLLVGSGLDVSSVLTYNSLGLANDDNGDNFSIGKAPVQLVLSGAPVNTAGSTLTRTAFDGSQTVYTWDSASSRYVAVNGTGAFDTITYAASKYTWVDGASQLKETYDGTNGRLLTRADAAGNTVTFGYDATSGLLTSVTDANGETVTYVYSGTLLMQIKAPVTTWSGTTLVTSVQPVVSYTYDTSNRLATVTVDLSPDGTVADGNVYTTSYTYDGSSKRVQTVTQTDGTKLTFVYDGSNRVYTITDALSNVTTFTYDTTNKKTSVLAGGQTTVYAYNAGGQLLSVTAPAVNGVNPVTQYLYNANGEVVSEIDADGRTTSMAYDPAGNLLSVLDGDGELTTRVYDAQNRLITETTTLDPTPALVATAGIASSGGTVSKTGTTSAWDASVRSSSGISGAAIVAFTVSSAATQLMVGLNADPDTDASYASIDYALSLNNGILAVYKNGAVVSASIGTYTAGDRLSVSYDGSGHVTFLKNGQLLYTLAATAAQPLYVDTSFFTSGSGVSNLTFGSPSTTPALTARYVYSADGKGLLRYTISPEGRVTEFGYDAQGLLISTIAYIAATYSTAGLASNAAPSEATMNTWRTTQDLTKIERTDIVRDTRGQLKTATTYASTTSAGVGVSGNTTTYIYDPWGRLMQTVEPGTATTNIAYDGLGRVKSTTDALGRMTITSYADAAGMVTVTYANQTVTTSAFDKDGRLISTTNSTAGTAKNTVDYDSLGHLLRTTDMTGMSAWYLYDADGRRVGAVDGTGALTEYVYDNAGLVTETIAYAAKVNTASLVDANGKPNNPSLASVRPTFNATTDQRSWVVYDAAGKVVQTISATGTVTQFSYDEAGRTTAVCDFATAVGVSSLGSAPAFQFVAPSAGDRIARSYYDGDGHLVGALDPDNYLTVYQYDAAGQQTVTISYANKSPAATAQSALSQLIPAASPGDRRTVALYSGEGLVSGTIDAMGFLTQYFYNGRHTLDHEIRYATSVGSSIAAGASVEAIKPAATGNDAKTSYVYDTGDRLTQMTDPDNLVTKYIYDTTTDKLLSTTTGYGRADAATTQSRYDAMGRVIATLDANGSARITSGMTQAQIDAIWSQYASKVTYDQAGRVASTTDALSHTTLFFYDGDGRLRYTVDPLNQVIERRYDALGNVTSTIAYAKAITPTGIGSGGLVTSGLTSAVNLVANSSLDLTTINEYDVNGRVVYSVDALGEATRMVYDALGQLVYAVAPDGAVTTNTYDADGRVIWIQTFATKLTAANLSSLPHAATASQVATMCSPSPGHDAITAYQYDAFGRVTFTMDGTGALKQFAYDADGNVVDSWAYAGTISVSSWSATGTISFGADALHDRHVHSSYDANGRVIAQADGTGAVVVNTYDADGRLTDVLRWGNTIAPGSWTSGTQPSYTASPADIHERFEYDADGRLTYTADGTGSVTAYTYDANGNLVQKTALFTKAVAGQTLASLTRLPLSDRSESFSYDAMNQRVWHLDAAGDLDYTAYDAAGQVTKTIRYAQAWTGAVPIATTIIAATGSDRINTFQYNAFGRVTYAVDGLNQVTLNTYDLAGRLQSTRRSAGTINAGADPSTVAVNALIDETTSFQYDAVGQVVQETDAMGGTQAWTYDGLGNKQTFTDAKGQVWTYTYDADGRELSETAPSVSVTTNAVNASGDLVETSAATSIVTSMTYDGTGNLTKRIEAFGRPDARESDYDYDAAGNRIAVTEPAFSTYDSHGSLISSAAVSSKAFYDAFGNVVATIDPAGDIAYTTYDQANRVAYSIDSLGYVTGEVRNIFGDVLTQTSYGAQSTLIGAKPTKAADAPTTGKVATAVGALSHVSDRVTTFTYDGLGQVKSVTGMTVTLADGTTAAPTTTYQYDAFGDRVLEAQLINQAQGVYASTYHYFDAAGQETDTVDALGYQTHRTFDAFGNTSQVLEYATAKTGTWSVASLGTTPTTSANDRTTTSVFDRLNRKTSEARTLDYSATDNGVVSGHTVTTQWGYDAEGHVTRLTDATGAVTYREYDALGHLRAVLDPTRASTVDGSAITPVTEYGYDAFGAVTIVSQRVNTATSVQEFTGVWTSAGAKGYAVVANSTGDRITHTLYDNGGHAIQVDDPMASTTNFHNTWNYYDANGRLTYTRHLVNASAADTTGYTVDTGYRYDAQGQVIATIAPTGSGTGLHEVTTNVQFNAFGEMTGRGIGGIYQEFYRYNANGQLWMTNQSDGVVHVYLHDLMGNVTADACSGGVGGDIDVSSYATESALAAALGNLRVQSTQYDALGRATTLIEAKRLNDAGFTLMTPTINQTFDRWGNVVSRSDARNAAWITTFAYNSANQLIQQVLPSVNLTSAGTTLVSYLAPTTRYFYDAAGRLTATIDADGDLSGELHDAAGQLVETDGHPTASTTVKTVSQYDIFGRKVRDIAANAFAPPPVNAYAAPGTVQPTQADYTTQYTYDLNDDLLSVQQGVGAGGSDPGSVAVWATQLGSTSVTGGTFQNLLESYTYDAGGNRLSAAQGTTSALGTATLFTYDAAGHLASTTLPSVNGVASVTLYGYDDFGHQSSQTDADGNTANWTYDYFGTRVTDHYDFGRTHYAYTYDKAGQLLTQTSTGGSTGGGQALTYSYDAAGQRTQVVDAATNTTSTYTYDAAGNRLLERTAKGGVNYQNNALAYDYDGRLRDSNDGTVHVTYNYDGVGNRTNVTTLLTLSGNLTSDNAQKVENTNYWFTYDGMNRQTGVDLTGVQNVTTGVVTLSTGTDGHQLTYDADGNRISDAFQSQNKVVITNPSSIIGYDSFGDPMYGTPAGTTSYGNATGLVTETYAYDALDRLSHSYRDGFLFDTELYDSAGRAVVEGPNPSTTDTRTVKVLSGWAGRANNSQPSSDGVTKSNKDNIDISTRINTYDAQGRLSSLTVSTSAGSVNATTISYAYHATNGVQDRGYDAAGNLLGTHTVSDTQLTRTSSGSGHEQYVVDQDVTTDETYAFKVGESYEAVMDTQNQSSYADDEGLGTITTSSHMQAVASAVDPNGHLSTVSVSSETASPTVVTYYTSNRSPTSTPGTVTNLTNLPVQYVYESGGQVLARIATAVSNVQLRSLVVDGELLGTFGTVVKSNTAAAGIYAEEFAEFDNGYRSLHDSSVNASVGSYTVRVGDTLQAIAQAAYGDSSLWQRIAHANGISKDSDLHVGLTLRLPSATATHDDQATASAGGTSQMLTVHNNQALVPPVHGWRAVPFVPPRDLTIGARLNGEDRDGIDASPADSSTSVSTVDNADGSQTVTVYQNAAPVAQITVDADSGVHISSGGDIQFQGGASSGGGSQTNSNLSSGRATVGEIWDGSSPSSGDATRNDVVSRTQGSGTTASPYVQPETGDHIVFAAPSPAPSYPDLSPYMHGGSAPGPGQGGEQVAASDSNWDSYTQLAAAAGYSGAGPDRLTLRSKDDDVSVNKDSQAKQIRDRIAYIDTTINMLKSMVTGSGGPGAGELSESSMYAAGYGDVRETSPMPMPAPIEAGPEDFTPFTPSPIDFQPIDVHVAGAQDSSVSISSSSQDPGNPGLFLDSRGTAGYSIVSWWDSQQRVGYKAAATANSNAYMQQINNLSRTQVTEGQAIAQDAFDARQTLRTATQDKLTPGGRLISQAIETNYTFDGQVARYTGEVAKRGPFSQMDVYRSVVRASGSSNTLVSGFNKVSRVAGPVGAVVGLGASAYNIANAAPGQTGRVASEEAGAFLGGMAGGMAATYVVGGLALAAGAVGVTVAAPVILIGGAIAGIAGALYGSQYGRDAGDYYYDTFSANWSH